jgi:hypothetical protein
MSNQTALDFFYENAGWGYRPDQETPEEGRWRGAETLAEAEAWAKDVGYTFTWRDDWDGDHSDYESGSGPESCEMVTLYDQDDNVIGSLGCIDDATEDYRRVVEAELAYEAMPVNDDNLIRSEN